MGRLIYNKGNLFEAPKDGILVHACNGYGVWGAGIAKTFKEKYPKSNEEYYNWCSDYAAKNEEAMPFGALVTSEKIGCLVTCKGTRPKDHDIPTILGNTVIALYELRSVIAQNRLPKIIHSNLFNSGLFGVSWHLTETVLEGFLQMHPDLTWTVWKNVENKIV